MSQEDSWYEQPDDWDENDRANETLPCPHCGAEIYEDAEQCPVCGDYVTPDTSVWSGRPVWWIVLAVLGLVATGFVFAGLTR